MTMTMRQKLQRSRRDASAALETYRSFGGQDTDDVAAIGDLICDLLHLAEAAGADDVPGLVESQIGHWSHESDPAHSEEFV